MMESRTIKGAAVSVLWPSWLAVGQCQPCVLQLYALQLCCGQHHKQHSVALVAAAHGGCGDSSDACLALTAVSAVAWTGFELSSLGVVVCIGRGRWLVPVGHIDIGCCAVDSFAE